MLTIDYGDTCPALYLRRPRGTLRAYAHHQRLEGYDVYTTLASVCAILPLTSIFPICKENRSFPRRSPD